MKQSNKILLGAFFLAILMWLAAPFLVLYPSFVFSKFSECEKIDDKELMKDAEKYSLIESRCNSFVGKMGQTGDVYGVTTSLFSGLALFAVAFALYADLGHRRRERKPLVVCNVENDGDINFDKPANDAEPKSCYFRGKISASCIVETAINVNISPSLFISGEKFPLTKVFVGVPMESGKVYKIDLSDMLSRRAIDILCQSKQQLPKVSLEFDVSCSNLDGESFFSSVLYDVSLLFDDNLHKIISMRQTGSGIDGAWDDRGAIPLRCSLKPNSWKFSSGSA